MVQVPQYLLDHIWGKGEACKIVCTQPRRISAISGLLSVHTKLLLFLVKYSSFFFSGMLYKVLKSLVFCSVAERIAYERGQTVGEDIGYKVTLLLSCLALVALLFYE